MNFIKLEKNNWILEVDLNGGRIVNLIKDDQKILGTFERIDGKKGNTHICTPNFANEGVEKFGFIFHGPFRNAEWNLASSKEDSLEIKCEIDGLLVRQKFLINEEFEQIIEMKGLMSEDDYRYEGKQHQQCQIDQKKIKVQINSYLNISSDENRSFSFSSISFPSA